MKERRSARLVVLDGQNRVLLFEFDDPRAHPHPFWCTPGGGVDEGETYEEAALRELWEETGMAGVTIGPWVWVREKEMDWLDQGRLHIVERYYVVRVSDPSVQVGNLLDYEQDVYRSHRWWRVDELRSTDAAVFPPGLADLLVPIVAGEIPPAPLSIE